MGYPIEIVMLIRRCSVAIGACHAERHAHFVTQIFEAAFFVAGLPLVPAIVEALMVLERGNALIVK